MLEEHIGTKLIRKIEAGYKFNKNNWDTESSDDSNDDDEVKGNNSGSSDNEEVKSVDLGESNDELEN